MGSNRIPPPREGLFAELRLLAGVKNGKDLNTFQKRHVAPLWPLTRLLCADDETATEVLMASLTRALVASGTWSSELPLDTWLRRRLVNDWLLREKRAGRVVDAPDRSPRRGRRGGRRQAAPGRRAGADLAFDDDGRLRRDPDGKGAGDSAAPDVDRGPALRLASSRLPPDLRIPWVLCDVCGEEPATVGEALEISTGLILSRLHRARRRLIVALDGGTSADTVRVDIPDGPTCQEVIALLWLDVDDAVPEGLQTSFRAHLDTCAPCSALRAAYRTLVDGAGSLRPENLPDNLTDHVRGAVDAMHAAVAVPETAETSTPETDENDENGDDTTAEQERPARRRRQTSSGRPAKRERAGEPASAETAVPPGDGPKKGDGPPPRATEAASQAPEKAAEERGEGSRRGSRRRRGRRNRSRNRPQQK